MDAKFSVCETNPFYGNPLNLLTDEPVEAAKGPWPQCLCWRRVHVCTYKPLTLRLEMVVLSLLSCVFQLFRIDSHSSSSRS